MGGRRCTFFLQKVDDFLLVVFNTQTKNARLTTPTLPDQQKIPLKIDIFLCPGGCTYNVPLEIMPKKFVAREECTCTHCTPGYAYAYRPLLLWSSPVVQFKRNFIVRSLLIMYDLCVFTCIIFIFVFRCTHVRMSYVLNSYLLAYLLNPAKDLGKHCKLPQWGPRQSSGAANAFLVYLELRECVCWLQMLFCFYWAESKN